MSFGRFLLIATALLICHARTADAFPELALRAGEVRCSACHVSPAGGGLLNNYGRDEAGSELSEGDGHFLYGALPLPDWLNLGGDFRGAMLANDVGGTRRTQLAAFPMQADLRGQVAHGAWSLVATGGLRGSTRDYRRSATSYFVSSEHYVMWQPDADGWYARVGRFMPPMGLRLPDHTLYVRRYTGTNLYEEPYALGVGYLGNVWETHGTVFVHDPLLDIGAREAGGALYVERHVGESAFGVSSRFGIGDESTRILGGIVARHYFKGPDIVLLAEEDLTYERVKGAHASRAQIATYADIDWRPFHTVNLATWFEHFHEDLGQPGLSHDGLGAAVRWYPRAHWEIIAMGRYQLVGTSDQARLAMLQIHYFL